MLQTAWQGYILSCDDVLDRVIECPASCGMLTGLDGASFVWATFSRPVPIGVGGGGSSAVPREGCSDTKVATELRLCPGRRKSDRYVLAA